MLKRISGIVAFLLAVAMAGPGWAGPLENELVAYLVQIDADGKESLTRTTAAAPGEIIEYRLIYRNVGSGELSGLVVDGPIPANTSYVAKSASSQVPNEFMVSIDGGKTWDQEPVRRMKKGDSGQQEEVVIGPDNYTHLRWVALEPLAPKVRQEYRYRVRIR